MKSNKFCGFIASRTARGFLATTTLIALSSISIANIPAGALSVGDFSPAHISMPAPPSSTASIYDWMTWSYQQQSFMHRIDWSTALSNVQCEVTDSVITQVVSDGSSGVPAGIVTDAVNLGGTCSLPIGNSLPGVLKSNSSRNCPIQIQGNYSSATGGNVCVGTATFDGMQGFMAASYTRTAASSSYGHAELGINTGSCDPGSLVVNGHPEMNVSTGSFSAVIWGPRNFSANWSSTWWQDNGGGNYSYFGSVCGNY